MKLQSRKTQHFEVLLIQNVPKSGIQFQIAVHSETAREVPQRVAVHLGQIQSQEVTVSALPVEGGMGVQVESAGAPVDRQEPGMGRPPKQL